MSKHKYNNWVQCISDRFQSKLDSISAVHGFEYGTEFEVILCKLLTAMLPDRYGVCRGYLVTEGGDVAGDDIIIYARSRFPTIAFRERGDFSRKEYVPIEAAYAYIEAKHTLQVHGTEAESLSKACAQVSAAKALVGRRSPVDHKNLGPYMKLPLQLSITPADYYPSIQNPFYAMIVSRQVRAERSGSVLDGSDLIVEHLSKEKITTPERPDLIVLGNSVVILPIIEGNRSEAPYASPFFIKNLSGYHIAKSSGVGFGIGVLSLLSALDWINLGVIPWKDIIGDALDVAPR